MSFKNNEKETAQRFLVELGAPVHELLTLREFARRDPDPEFNIDHLDSVCPDIVAITATCAVGLELTAYSDDDSQNRLGAVSDDLRDAGAELADQFPDLCGFDIRVSPDQRNILRRRDACQLAGQVLEFVRSSHRSDPFAPDQCRHFSAYVSRSRRTPFADWPMLEQHVQSITVRARSAVKEAPVVLHGRFASHFGTNLDCLTQTIVTKSAKLKNAYTRGLSAVWLVIHADGVPRSSRITPMRPEEIDRLRSSLVPQIATESGFTRVFLWDGVRGGVIDLSNWEPSFAHHG